MNDPIKHLPNIDTVEMQTSRLKTHVLVAGPATGEPVIFLHGNLSTATFWEETMLALPKRFRALAPDQRGFGQADPTALIDARRGVADWADDMIALADHLGWQRFHLVGHSLGGCVGWSLLGSQSHRLSSMTLIAPGPPCGFPGAHGKAGELNHEDGAGSGAGVAHPQFVERLEAGQRETADDLFSPRAVMNRAYWRPPFRPRREEDLLTAMLQVHLGENRYPGDSTASPHWPGFAPGRYGPVNALSPRYNQSVLENLLAVQPKPRLLWIYGNDDAVVNDHALLDPGMQGQLGLRPDWPGQDEFPPQPLLTQVKFALDQYERNGGEVRRQILPDVGHTPFLEKPEFVNAALVEHLDRGT